MPDSLPDAGPVGTVSGRLRRRLTVHPNGALLSGRTEAQTPLGYLPLDAVLGMIYPTRDPSEMHAQAHALVGDFVNLHGLRQILSSFDRQFYPTPATVHFGPDEVITHRLDNGITIYLDPEDGAVSRPIVAGDYEAHLLPAFKQYCKPGMVVVDIGANVGLYTMLASTLVGPSGRVVSIEPSSENCRLILLSLAANQVRNVEVLPLALDRARGWSNLSGHFGSNGGLVPTDAANVASGRCEIVATFPLDDLVEGRVDFLKIDVEGAEGRVVAGAQRILETWRPIVTTELSLEMLGRVSGIGGEEYLETFAKLGYRISILNRSTGLPDAPTTAQHIMKDWADPLQIEDLLLLPPDD
jgi:FkbM family methyltransferase